MTPRPSALSTRVLAAVLLATALSARADDGTAQWRLRRDDAQAATLGPQAQARALAPSLLEPIRGRWVTEARWQRTVLLGAGFSASADLAATATQPDAGPATLRGRANELVLTREQGLWMLAAGRQVVSWDVGFGFRPNDMVQQERRLTLIDAPLQGRSVLTVERFGEDRALSLAWVNPGRSTLDQTLDGREQALSSRLFQRLGEADLHLFMRWGEHTRGSLGAAATWVFSDAVAAHASGRVMRRHVAWRGPAGDALYPSNPWVAALQGAAAQGLLGITWTSAQRWSLMGELWYDGTATSNESWRTWNDRQRGLVRLPAQAPAQARAAQWAWQATPLSAPQLRRVATLARVSWQDGPWQLALDQLWHPADGGRILSAGLVWQGHRTRWSAAWRRFGGPDRALTTQLPQRTAAAVELSWTF